MSADKPELFASVKRLIKERNELEKAIPLGKSEFGKWPKKKKQTPRPRLADCDDAIAELIGDEDEHAAQVSLEPALVHPRGSEELED
jgi:hypothetical protein